MIIDFIQSLLIVVGIISKYDSCEIKFLFHKKEIY